jgi:hypothetical protein
VLASEQTEELVVEAWLALEVEVEDHLEYYRLHGVLRLQFLLSDHRTFRFLDQRGMLLMLFRLP